MFGQHPFDRYSENDVRENIIRPLLRELGYGPEMVTTQLALKYDRLFLGHKKGARDRDLRGEADYIMDVDGRLRWVIEAKRPGEITDDDREQAFSYAMHPQVRAILFSVMTGTHFEVFHTFEKPEGGPLLAFTYEQLPDSFPRLSNVATPDSLRRNHPKLQIDVGKPLAPGLRSFAKVESGTLTYTESPRSKESVVGMTVHLTEGSVVRRGCGGIVALVRPSFHHTNFTRFTSAIDATELELITDDEYISTDPSKPTVFSQTREITVREGTQVPSFSSFSTTPAQVSVTSVVSVTVSGYMTGQRFIGSLLANSVIQQAGIQFRIRANLELVLH